MKALTQSGKYNLRNVSALLVVEKRIDDVNGDSQRTVSDEGTLHRRRIFRSNITPAAYFSSSHRGTEFARACLFLEVQQDL